MYVFMCMCVHVCACVCVQMCVFERVSGWVHIPFLLGLSSQAFLIIPTFVSIASGSVLVSSF